MSENKTGKYLKYAIGEIILVVIGILIALQINNWNEAKNNEERFFGILKEIETDLYNDLISGTSAIRNGKKQDSLFLMVLNSELTTNDYKNNEDYNLYWLGLKYTPFEYQKRGFAKFENFSGIIPIQYEEVAEWISRHYSVTCATFDKSHSNITQTVMGRQEYMALNYPWFNQLQFESRNKDIIGFYMNDPIYKNWIFQSYQFNTTGSNTAMTNLLNSIYRLLIIIADIQDEKIDGIRFLNEFVGQQLTESEKDIVGTYYRGETGRTFNLEIKAGFLMYDGIMLLKKIGPDKFQSADFPDWYYEIKRDESNNVEKFIMKDTKQSRIIKCEKRDD